MNMVELSNQWCKIEIVMRKADNKGAEAKLKVSHDDGRDYHPDILCCR